MRGKGTSVSTEQEIVGVSGTAHSLKGCTRDRELLMQGFWMWAYAVHSPGKAAFHPCNSAEIALASSSSRSWPSGFGASGRLMMTSEHPTELCTMRLWISSHSYLLGRVGIIGRRGERYPSSTANKAHRLRLPRQHAQRAVTMRAR